MRSDASGGGKTERERERERERAKKMFVLRLGLHHEYIFDAEYSLCI